LFTTIRSRFDWRAQELGKTIGSTVAPELQVEGDRLRLEQALANLVDNALRYGGDDITLHAVAGSGRVELHVSDNGDGLPDAFLSHAFERFARHDAARGGTGSGLGLSIVRTIAESHGGRAHIVRRGRGGADAWLSLPAGSVHVRDQARH
jgi:signal transduction histidine kinase